MFPCLESGRRLATANGTQESGHRAEGAKGWAKTSGPFTRSHQPVGQQGSLELCWRGLAVVHAQHGQEEGSRRSETFGSSTPARPGASLGRPQTW